jgi:hypothetical protein
MKYTFQSKKFEWIRFSLSYVKGKLRIANFDIGKDLADDRFQLILSAIKLNSFPSTKAKLIELGFALTDQPKTDMGETSAWKVTLWLTYWREFRKTDFTMSDADAAKLASMKYAKPDYEAMMKYYFSEDDWFCKSGYETVGGFMKHANTLLSLIRQSGKRKFPDRFDRDLIRKLNGQDYMDYLKHLRGLGYKFKKNATGSIIDAYKPDMTTAQAAQQVIEDTSKPD